MARYRQAPSRLLGRANALEWEAVSKTRTFVRCLHMFPLPVHEKSSYVIIYCHFIKSEKYSEQK